MRNVQHLRLCALATEHFFLWDAAVFAGEIIILAFLAIALLTLIANLFVFGSLRVAPAPPAAQAPLISVLIPARNEALNIAACAGSLLLQDYPHYELIVLDDHSTDGTGEIVERLFAEHPAVKTKLLRGESLPAGWTGKGWACHQLSLAASGEVLFFTDADTTHAPGLLSAAFAHARRTRADLLSAWPRFITRTLGEQLIVPVIVLIGATMVHHWLLALMQRFPQLATQLGPNTARALAGANGQFMFFQRAAYERIGGHAAVKAHIVEDVALGRAVAAHTAGGMRLINCDSIHFSTVRMYRSFGESWLGFTKNLRAAFDRERGLFWLFVAGLFFVWLLPSVAFLFKMESWPALAAAALVWAMRLVVTWRWRLAWTSALLHPASIAVMIGIAINSWRLSRGRGVEWKGRTYKPEV